MAREITQLSFRFEGYEVTVNQLYFKQDLDIVSDLLSYSVFKTTLRSTKRHTFFRSVRRGEGGGGGGGGGVRTHLLN